MKFTVTDKLEAAEAERDRLREALEDAHANAQMIQQELPDLRENIKGLMDGREQLRVALERVRRDRDRIATAAYGDAAIVQGLREELESCRQEKSSAYAAGELFGIGQATKLAVEQEMVEARATIERLEALVPCDDNCASHRCKDCGRVWRTDCTCGDVCKCVPVPCNCTRPKRIAGAKGEPK